MVTCTIMFECARRTGAGHTPTTGSSRCWRTFGCVRVAWNQTLAERRRLWRAESRSLSYAASDAALTAMKQDPGLAFLNEVSSVPLRQALRHQHKAFSAFFAGRARYPRFKSRRSRQSAHYTRSAFSMRGGVLRIARTSGPLRFVWSWPDVEATSLNPTMVVVSREPDGRWYATFAVDGGAAAPLPPAGHAVGVDLGVTDFAVTSDGQRIASPRHLERRARNLARHQRRMAAASAGRRTGPRPGRRPPAPTARSATPGATSCTAPAPGWPAATT